MADRLPERATAALARTTLRPRKSTDQLGVPGRIAERRNAAEGTDTRQRPRLVARGRVERRPPDDGVPLVSADDVCSRFINLASIPDRPDGGASQRRSDFPRTGLTASPPRGYGHQRF